MIKLLELKFSRRWQTNKIESVWSNSPRHSSSRQFRSPRNSSLNYHDAARSLLNKKSNFMVLITFATNNFPHGDPLVLLSLLTLESACLYAELDSR